MHLFDLVWLSPLLLLGLALLKRAAQTDPESSVLLDLDSADQTDLHLETEAVKTIAPANRASDLPVPEAVLPVDFAPPQSPLSAPPASLSSLNSSTMADLPEAESISSPVQSPDAVEASRSALEPKAESSPAESNPAEPDQDIEAESSLAESSLAESAPNPFDLAFAFTTSPLKLPACGAALDVETFQQTFLANLQNRGQTLQTATLQDCYSLLLDMVNGALLPSALTQAQDAHQTGPTVVEVALEFALTLPLETHVTQLQLADSLQQGLQALGLDLTALYHQDLLLADEGTGRLSSGYLEARATNRRPALGQGLYWPTVSSSVQSRLDDWLVPVSEAALTVQFGGYTTDGLDAQGRYQRHWQAATTIIALPYDLPVVGYSSSTNPGNTGPSVNRLRLWQVELSPRSEAGEQLLEQQLQWHYALATCAVQDLIRQQLQAKRPLTSLAEQFAIRLNDTATVWVIPELMHQLVDRQGLGWDLAWSITQALVSWVCRDLLPPTALAPSDRRGLYPVALVQRLLPRHLEIIYEINRRWLARVAAEPPLVAKQPSASVATPDPTNRLIQASLIDETGERYLRLGHLAAVGAARVSGAIPLHTQLIQTTLLPEFSRLYPGKFIVQTDGLSPRRFLRQTQPDLVELIAQHLGKTWLEQPDQWQQLEERVQDAQFCGQWWEHKRAAKRTLAAQLQQISRTDLAINPASLFEVQADSSAAAQVLNLLHLITLYARIKTNASTDTILRFAHRSLPRTCILVGQSDHPLADQIAALTQAVATTISSDLATPQLQVSVLADSSFRQLRSIYPATDLALQIAPAGQTALETSALAFAMNGALLAATPTYTNLEIRQAIGAKNLFLFGPMAMNLARRPNPQQIYSTNPDLKQAVDLIASGYFSQGEGGQFRPLLDWLRQDPDQVLTHYGDYVQCQERISQAYQDQKTWTWMSMLTLARLGQFSADAIT